MKTIVDEYVALICNEISKFKSATHTELKKSVGNLPRKKKTTKR